MRHSSWPGVFRPSRLGRQCRAILVGVAGTSPVATKTMCGETNDHQRRRARHDRGRQDRHQDPVPQSAHLRDRDRARGLPEDGARTARHPGNRTRLRADLRRRHPRPQSEPRPHALRHRLPRAQARALDRPVALERPAHGAPGRRRADLHHLREQREGRGHRSEDADDDRRHRFRLDQRPSPGDPRRRPAPLHRQRGGRDRLGHRPAEPQAARQDRDAGEARRHRRIRRRQRP